MIVMELAGIRQTRAWLAAGRHQRLLDGALGLTMGVVSLVMVRMGPRDQPPQDITWYRVAAAVVVTFAIACRRRSPMRALLTIAAVAVGLIAGDDAEQVTAALMVGTYTLALSADRRTTWRTTVGVVSLLWLADALWGSRNWWNPASIVNFAWLGMALAYGDATRSRRAYVAAIEERALRAEQTRDDEARRRVVEERLRIARELHDVVAHHIAVIKVQATGAQHILRRRPDQVAPALDAVSRSADAALKEMASVVGLLRGSDDSAARTQPPPGLACLTGLLDNLSTHLAVDHHQLGDPRDLPAVVDVAAYRIVQEALTNAQKYGDGAADLTVAYTPDGVTLHITNAIGRERTDSGSGHGIVGMRERAAALGGTVTAGAAEAGRFAVHASLPTVYQR
jgi:signal transduction histidine kinase